MRFVLLLATLEIVACAQLIPPDPRVFKTQDSAFKYEVQLFESLYTRSTAGISIGFSDLKDNMVGLCTRWTSGYRQIQIDRDYWFNPSTTQEAKIGLIFHEMGHCALNRGHNNETFYYSGSHILGDVPTSLMNMYNFYSPYYKELQSYYFDELFTPSTLEPAQHQSSPCVMEIDDSSVN